MIPYDIKRDLMSFHGRERSAWPIQPTKKTRPPANEPTGEIEALDELKAAAADSEAEADADPLPHVDGNAKLDASDIEKLLDQASESLEEAAGDKVSTDAEAKPYSLNDLSPEQELAERQPIDLLGEVEMDLRIELGRTQMRLEEVLELRNGFRCRVR